MMKVSSEHKLSPFLVSPKEMIVVGRFGKSVGLDGCIRVTLFTDFIDVFRDGVVFYVPYTQNTQSLLPLLDTLNNSYSFVDAVQNFSNNIEKQSITMDSAYTEHGDSNGNNSICDGLQTKVAEYLPIRIKYFNPVKNTMKLYEINSRERSDVLCNTFFYSTISDTRALCALDNDEFFYFDIIGMRVVENGVEIGVVKDIQDIANTHYLILDKNFLIPYIDRYVIEVNLQDKQIITRDARFLNMKA